MLIKIKGDIVIRGLTELNKERPKIPLLFLGSWLLNESRSYEIKRKINYYNVKKEELKQDYEILIKQKEKENKKEQEIIKSEEDKLKEFHNLIKTNTDMEGSLSKIADGLKEFTSI